MVLKFYAEQKYYLQIDLNVLPDFGMWKSDLRSCLPLGVREKWEYFSTCNANRWWLSSNSHEIPILALM